MSVPCRALLTMLALAACGERDHAPLAYPPEPVPPGLRERAEAGNAAAQFALAEHLWPAHPGDPEPFYWRVAAACQGDPVAQTSLGALYYAGDGVTADHLEADLWSARAAEQGESEGRLLADELRATLTEAERAWAVEHLGLTDAPDCVQWRR